METPFQQDGFPSLVALDTYQHEETHIVDVNKIFVAWQEYILKKDLLTKYGDAAEWSTADMLSACAFATTGRLKHRTSIDLDRSLQDTDQSIYDPRRTAPCFAPPKRFFRTFWISAAMRLLESDVAKCNH
jgi:hypothetical protein